jgi:hypothetical protein
MMRPGALKAFQQRMAAAVMAPLTSRNTMVRRRPDGVRMEDEAAAFVKPNDRLSSFERLEIYNRQYWFRIMDSLGEDFPGLRAVLGRIRFDGLVRAYLAQCPSRSFTLRNLGSRLPAWLEANPQWIDPRGRFALDTVRLEWAHIEAFDAAEDPVLTADGLAAVDESTRLFLQPHVRLLHLAYPVDDLLVKVRQDLARDGDGTPRHRGVRRTPPCAPRETFLAVHRRDQSVYYKRLNPESFRILRAIQSGATLGVALEAGFETSTVPEAKRPAFLREIFHDWAAFGWFARTGSTSSNPGGSDE